MILEASLDKTVENLPCDVIALIATYIDCKLQQVMLMNVNKKFASVLRQRRVINVKAAIKNYAFIEWVIVNGNLQTSAMARQATRENRLDILRYLIRSNFYLPRGLTQIAAKHGWLDLLKWLVKEGGCSFSLQIIEEAAYGGHIDILEWACPQTTQRWNTPVILARERGYHLTTNWLMMRGWPLH
jgi:hypothetical protein